MKTQGAQAQFSAGQYFSLELSVSKQDPFADGQLSTGSHERLPKTLGQLSRQKHLYRSRQVLSRGLARRAFGMYPRASAEQAGRENPRIVEDQQLVATEKLGQFSKTAVFEAALDPLEEEHSRSIAVGKRTLGDQFRRQRIVELSDLHARQL
jgi:hypothetical protein